MALLDYIQRYPRAIYPYFIARAGLRAIPAAAAVAVSSLLRGKMLWSPHFPKTNDELDMFKTLMQGRSADYCMAVGTTMSFFSDRYIEVFKRMARHPEKLVWHEDLVPTEIIEAMGLIPFMVEEPGIMAPLIAPELTHYYIDVAENAGYPGDICTLPKTSLGMVLDGLFPQPSAIITSNSPCDGGMAYYVPIEQKMKVPVFRIDLPYNVYEPRAQEYCLKEIRRLIKFLEDLSGTRLDLERLKKICEIRNRTYEMTLELWELIKQQPSPMGGDVLFLSHLTYQVAPGTELALRTIEKVLEVAKNNFKKGTGPVKNEKHRAVLWNPPPLVCLDMFKWLEEEYNTVMVMDMLTFSRQPIIDTSSEESMLRGLTDIISKGPMARHTRGPVEFFFDDLFRIYEDFQADMIIMAAHLNCKNTRAVLSMFRDYCRRDGIPLLIIDYDLSDARVVSPEGVRKQVAEFMETVMVNY